MFKHKINDTNIKYLIEPRLALKAIFLSLIECFCSIGIPLKNRRYHQNYHMFGKTFEILVEMP